MSHREADQILRHMEGYIDLSTHPVKYTDKNYGLCIRALFVDALYARKAASKLDGYVIDRKKPAFAGVLRVLEIRP
jgi:hypothetical protein